MDRICAQCRQCLDSDAYTTNQWFKGDGESRCMDCVDSNHKPIRCLECRRIFRTENELLMHSQVHRPRTITCPICGGSKKFKTNANAVQHIESGFCASCEGSRENARAQIYDFVHKQAPMRQFLSNAPMISYSSSSITIEVPDYPYKCPSCNKLFRQLSQLMQHQDQKHNEQMTLRIGY